MKQFTLEEKNEVLENPFIHIHRKLDVLLNIGKLLMECGADTNFLYYDYGQFTA